MLRKVIRKVMYGIQLQLFMKKWRIKNVQNHTTVKSIFPINKVEIGKHTYGVINVSTFGNDSEFLRIGSFCSIATNVRFLLGGEHFYKGLSTFPFRKYFLDEDENTPTKGPIVVKDDVWIGDSSLILSGVEIGQGAIIAAGSIVARNIPPYAIFAGGRIIKYRFSEKVIMRLLEFDFSELTKRSIINNIDFLYSKIDESGLEADLMRLIGGDQK